LKCALQYKKSVATDALIGRIPICARHSTKSRVISQWPRKKSYDVLMILRIFHFSVFTIIMEVDMKDDDAYGKQIGE
jgi:hypothetical protein